MLRYIVRRVLYMIPTVFGVILLTFFLFHVAGGDPAKMRLGKQATPRLLEEYDLQRGYNKPLFCGNWGTTRAYSSLKLADSPGGWRHVEGAGYEREPIARIVLPEGRYAIPLAFPLSPEERYAWTIEYRLVSPAGEDAARARFVMEENGVALGEDELSASSSWRKKVIKFSAAADAEQPACMIVVENGMLEFRRLSLQRKVGHFFDSQLFFYLRQLARFDFGTSLETNQRISRMIRDGILPSLALTVPIFFISMVVAISLSLICSFFRNRFIDRFFVVISVILMSVNYLVWIVVGQYYLGYIKRWFPIWGFESWRHLMLPVLIGVISGLGSQIRFYRTIMLDQMYRDYVRTAFAKGVSRRGVLFRHVLKNAMIPILTSVVMAIPFLYTGSLLLESFFGIPGLGMISINALRSSDGDVIKAVVFVGAMIYVVANLITDISYTLVDPRVRLK